MDSLSLKNLTNALSEVDSWQQLGVQLDINYHKLKEFWSLPTVEERKLAMLQCWLDTDLQASWKKLLCGLRNMGLNRVAEQIQEKYQLPPSHQADIAPVPPPSPPEHLARIAPSSPQTSVGRKREVQCEIDTLKGMYDDLVIKAVESFKEKHTETPTFLSRLRTSIASLPSSLKDEHIHFLRERSSEIAKATSVDELFIIVSCYSDFLNCSLVVYIVSRFGDAKLMQDLQNYTAELEAFRSHTNLSDFVAALTGSQEIPPDFLKLVLKMGPEWELRTLKDLEQFHETLKGKSFLASYAVRLMGGNTGSIFLIWSVPRKCKRFLIPSLDSHFLQQFNIERVTIDGDNLAKYRRRHFPDFSSKHVDEFSEGLVWASGEGCLEDVIFLLSTGVDVNGRGEWQERTALMVASEHGHLDVVRELLRARADVNAQDMRLESTALMLASKGGHLDVVRELLRAQADENMQDKWKKTALILASKGGHLDVVRELLKAQADVNVQDKWSERTALMLASERGHLDVVGELLRAQADVNAQDMRKGRTALMLASQGGRLSVVRELLRALADVNARDEDGWNALMLASMGGHLDVVRELLKAQADINVQDKDGMTALMGATSGGHSDLVRFLLSAGAQADLQNEHGLTALMNAARFGDTETVRALIEAGANVNLQQRTSGRSAVFFGAEEGHLEVMKLLIQGGANLNFKDKDGVTADEVAEVHGHRAICDELRKHVHVGRAPLSKAVRDRVLITGNLLRALYKNLEEKISRTQKKELARMTQGLDLEIPLLSTPGRKGVRDPLGHRQLLEYTDMPRSAH